MTTRAFDLPKTQHAVQLTGPGELKLNPSKPVPTPGPHEILVKVEAVGLCFSDLKLLKQFHNHARKSEIVAGIEKGVLQGMQSYLPGNAPVVPGHEVVCRIVAIGDKVKKHEVGERCLVQTDYRQLPTAAGSNAAFGYNFDGGLQEYTLLDERVVVAPNGDRFLIRVGEEKSASAIALVEPWACVEDSYLSVERQHVKPGGRLVIVALDDGADSKVKQCWQATAQPAEVRTINSAEAANLPNESLDDIVYFGSDRATIEILSDKLAPGGIINIVLGGKRIGEAASVGVGRVHYGGTRWIGTTSSDPARSYGNIPATGEVRAQDRVLVVGAGGPMGQMHVIRDVCSIAGGVSVVGTDLDDARLETLRKKAGPLAKANRVSLRLVNNQKNPLQQKFTYFALMAPVGALIASAIQDADDGALINIFAGIAAPTKHALDLDTYIEKRCYMFGTSGSTIDDMRIVLKKVEQDGFDTNASVDAISGMAGAIDGMASVENRTLAGKIIVYPMLHDVGLIPLGELHKHFPTVAEKLDGAKWTRAAEDELLRVVRHRD